MIVTWRFTGTRTPSDTAERRAQHGMATSFWLRAAQAAAVLAGLVISAVRPGGWWIDPVIDLGIAAVSVREGTESWRGDDCC